MWYQGFGGPLYWSSQLPAVDQVGAVPLISWDPVGSSGKPIPFAAIASGGYDDYLRASAQLAKRYARPMMIRFAHEMNLATSPFGPGQVGNSASTFIDAWRHIVTIFRTEGASNVRWVWSPDVDWGGKTPFDEFFPGSTYVDWVALDGYNAATLHGGTWQNLSSIFGPSYDDLLALAPGKPIMIAETATTEVGGDKAAWIIDAFTHDLPEQLPQVRAIVWFDRLKETDWRVNSSATSLAAWRSVIALPRYSVPFVLG